MRFRTASIDTLAQLLELLTRGVGHWFVRAIPRRLNLVAAFWLKERLKLRLAVTGVGQDPEPVSSVRGAAG